MIKEQEEQAQIIIDAAVERLRGLGFALVADGTVYGDGVWIDRLRVRRLPPAQALAPTDDHDADDRHL